MKIIGNELEKIVETKREEGLTWVSGNLPDSVQEVQDEAFLELNNVLIKKGIVYSRSSDDCSESLLSHIYDWGFMVDRYDETGHFCLFYDTDCELIISVCVDSDYYQCCNYEITDDVITVTSADGETKEININKKEGKAMPMSVILERAKALMDSIEKNPKIQDKEYLDRPKLRSAIKDTLKLEEDPFNNRSTRKEMVAYLKDAIVFFEEHIKAVSESETTVETAEAPIEVKDDFNDKNKLLVLKKVILQADKNHSKNIISLWMLKSAISEVLLGKPLKQKVDGKIIDNSLLFSDEENSRIDRFLKKMVINAKLKAITKITIDINGKQTEYTSAYVIPAKVLVYGRHKFLNRACVYGYKLEDGGILEYTVSLDGIKNPKTGVVTQMSDKVYETLEDKRFSFIR